MHKNLSVIIWYRRVSLVVRARVGGRGFDPRPRQTKIFKTRNHGFPPWRSGIMDIALRQAIQWQDNGLVKYWIEIAQETWICELSQFNNWNTVDTA